MSHANEDRAEKVDAIIEGLNALPEVRHLDIETKRAFAEAVLQSLLNAGFAVTRSPDDA
jgi:hypothetical protein